MLVPLDAARVPAFPGLGVQGRGWGVQESLTRLTRSDQWPTWSKLDDSTCGGDTEILVEQQPPQGGSSLIMMVLSGHAIA